MSTKDYASGSDCGEGKTAIEELEYFIANKPMYDQPTYLYMRHPDAMKKRIGELLEQKPSKPNLLGRLKRLFSSAWRS